MKEKTKDLIKKGKWLRSALLTIALILVIIALYVGLNIFVRSLDLSDIDITQDKLYSLSQESIDKIKNVNTDTRIILYGMSDYPEVEQYAKLYASQNSHISYEVLTDATQRSDLQNEYGLGITATSLIIVETDARKKAVMTSDLYTYDYTTYEEINTTEQALTNAILDVNLAENPNIYFVTNHVKYSDQYEALKEYLKNEANNVQTLDLLVSGKVPEDCDALVITTLEEDFSEYESNLVIDYINNGGNLMILEEPNYTGLTLTNFQKILDQYGVSISNGVIFETDENNEISGYPNFIIPQVSYSSDITQYIASDGAVALIDTGRIEFKSDEELEALGVSFEKLVTATDSSFLRSDTSITTPNMTDSDIQMSGDVLGAAITKQLSEGENKESKLVLYASSVFASDLAITLYGSSSNSSSRIMGIAFYNNKDLVINSISYLSSRTDNLTIRKDTGTISTFTATQEQTDIIQAIVIALPIVILLIGIIVWQVRRRKK